MAIQDQNSERLEKIREIIFGQQMEDYESRLNQLNTVITNEKETSKTYLESSFDKLTVRQDKEQKSNNDAFEKIQRDVDSLKTELSSSIKTLEDNFLAFKKEIKESYISKDDLSQHLHSLIGQLAGNSAGNSAELKLSS